MANYAEDWTPIAKTLNYPSEKDMLVDLYTNKGMSIAELVKKLGYAQNTVRARLYYHGITMRGRGGNNAEGKTKLRHVSDERLLKLKPGQVVKGTNNLPMEVLASTLYHEKKRRGLWNSQRSVRRQCSTGILEEAAPKCVSPLGLYEILSTSSGTGLEDSLEILCSWITAPTKKKL